MASVSWVVRIEDAEDEPIMLGDSTVEDLARSTAPLAEVIGGLVEQASEAVPSGAECEVEIGGRITRTAEGAAEGSVRAWVFELSLGGKGTISSEGDFRLRFRFTTPERNAAT